MRPTPPQQGHSRTTAAWNIAYLVAYAERRGLTRGQLGEHFEIDFAALEAVDGRLPLRTLVRMWNELPELTNDPDMPLHVIEHATAAEMPLSALLFLASPTLGQGFKQLERYQRITHDLSDTQTSCWVLDGAVAYVVLYHERSELPPPTGAVIDALLGMLLMARMATGVEITPLSITLRHPRPTNEAAYHQAFRCKISFGAARDRMTLRASDLALPHLEPSRTVQLIASKHADTVLATLPKASDALSQVRSELRTRLAHGEISLDELARAVGASKRTLQRRLARSGTSLRELVDEERKHLAVECIKQRHLSITDIALLLGFSELSTFTRAFTRWTKVAPTEFRRILSEEQP